METKSDRRQETQVNICSVSLLGCSLLACSSCYKLFAYSICTSKMSYNFTFTPYTHIWFRHIHHLNQQSAKKRSLCAGKSVPEADGACHAADCSWHSHKPVAHAWKRAMPAGAADPGSSTAAQRLGVICGATERFPDRFGKDCGGHRIWPFVALKNKGNRMQGAASIDFRHPWWGPGTYPPHKLGDAYMPFNLLINTANVLHCLWWPETNDKVDPGINHEP